MIVDVPERRRNGERGQVIPLAAVVMVVLVFMATFAVDLGLLYNERRQDQSAVDSGSLGGAQAVARGRAPAAESAAELVRENLDTVYTDADWRAQWAADSCTDDDRLALTGGTVLGTSTDCISFDPLGAMRVRVPDQVRDSVFARVLGIDSLSSSAAAEVTYDLPGDGGVLPFAVLSGAGTGSQLCLRSGTSGQAIPPCSGSASGNFGALQSPQYGNPRFGTEGIPCNLNKNDQLAVNISVGIDHFLRSWSAELGTIEDVCQTFGPDALLTSTGVGSALLQGMVHGLSASSVSIPGRLTRGTNAKRPIRFGGATYQVDNRPLWEYIPTGKSAQVVPASCRREVFDALAVSARTAHLGTCLSDYVDVGPRGVLFDLDTDDDGDADIIDGSRFAFVPQFHEASFPNGSQHLRISSFRAVYLQGMWFGCVGAGASTCDAIVHPGESGDRVDLGGGTNTLDQVSGFLLPNEALPADVLSHGPGGRLGPFVPRLSR